MRSFSSLNAVFALSSSALRETLCVVKPKNNIVDEHDAVISIRLTREQHERLKALAAREQRTMSQQVRHLVDVAITAEHAEAAAQ